MALFSKIKRMLANVVGKILLTARVETVAAQLALDEGWLEARLRDAAHGIAHSVHYSAAGVGTRISQATRRMVPSVVAMMNPELPRDSCAV
jgi:hypothetical protein